VSAAGTDPLARRRRWLTAVWADTLRRFRDHMHEGTPMPSSPDPADNVRQLRRPPIRQHTIVRSDAAHTFDAFVRTIGAWWPVRPFSIGQERVAEVVFERRLGGRVYEAWDDGEQVTWGHVLAWDPPAGFTMSWEILPATTEIQLTFRALGPALTRVELEHRGWERLTEEQLAQATAVPGGYSAGWARVLAAFAETQQ
jgi:Activator of Hsp90 ATPase homolog 1-like protein